MDHPTAPQAPAGGDDELVDALADVLLYLASLEDGAEPPPGDAAA